MHRHRFFLTASFSGGTLPLASKDVHHIRDVLRLGPGAIVDVVEAGGRAMTVSIEAVGGTSVSGTVIDSLELVPHLPLTLCHALSKGRKMDLVVQKATELGVERIVPFSCERSVTRLEPAKSVERRERWQRIAEEAAKQCRRVSIPPVDTPVAVEGLKQIIGPAARTLLLWEEATLPLRAPLSEEVRGRTALAETSGSTTALVVGPEGGFTREEVALMSSWGAVPVSLGRLILRTETASIAACAILAYESGWLGGARK